MNPRLLATADLNAAIRPRMNRFWSLTLSDLNDQSADRSLPRTATENRAQRTEYEVRFSAKFWLTVFGGFGPKTRMPTADCWEGGRRR